MHIKKWHTFLLACFLGLSASTQVSLAGKDTDTNKTQKTQKNSSAWLVLLGGSAVLFITLYFIDNLLSTVKKNKKTQKLVVNDKNNNGKNVVSKKQKPQHKKPVEEPITCPACQEPYNNNKIQVKFPCKHDMCQECSRQWFFLTVDNEVYFDPSKTCPTCRQPVNQHDLEEQLTI